MAGRFSVEAVFKAIDNITMPVNRMQNRMRRFTRSVTKGFRNLNRTVDRTIAKIGRLGRRTLTAVTAGLGTVALATKGVLQEFAAFENATTAFIPLLGSLEKADSLMKSIGETAVTTPFQIEDLSRNAAVLISMGAATRDDVIPMLRMLGDVSGGSADRLNRLAVNFAEINANGRAFTRDIRQFTTAGVPLLMELADMWGVSVEKASDMVTQGKATGEEVTKALRRMTGVGGKFFRAMDLASETNTGLWSNLKENISLTAVAIGKEISPTVKEITKDLIRLTGELREWVKLHGQDIRDAISGAYQWFKDNWRDIIEGFKSFFKWTKILLGVYLSLKIATFAWNTMLFISEGVLWLAAKRTKIFTGLLWLWRKAVIAVTAVQWLWNAALNANPIGLVIAAIAALVAAGIYLWNNWDKVKQFFIDLWDSMPNAFKWGIKLIFAPIMLLIKAVKLITDNWGKIKDFFTGIWDWVTKVTDAAINWVIQKIDDAKQKVNEFMNWVADLNPLKEVGETIGRALFKVEGFDDFDPNAPAVISPQERMRIDKIIQESNTKSEVVIKDESGKAQVQGDKLPSNIKLQPSAAF